MNRKQRNITRILAVAILGTIVGMKAWTPERRPVGTTERQGGKVDATPVNNTMPLTKPAQKRGN